MNNPFQEQLLKAGLVTKQQVQKAKKETQKKNKQSHSKKQKVVDDSTLKAQQAAKEKLKQDQALNKRKEDQARKKAISIEINQLVLNNKIKREEDCDIVYNFEHQNKIQRIYVNAEIKKQIIQGKAGIARSEGRYEIVPRATAEKIRQRNENRIILFDNEEKSVDENDPYAEHQIPDDLMW